MKRERVSEADVAGGRWRKSSYSQNAGDCVEVAPLARGTGVRDTKARPAGALLVAREEWGSFVAAVKADALHRR